MSKIDFRDLQRLRANLEYLEHEVVEAHNTLDAWGVPQWDEDEALFSVSGRITILANTLGDLIPSIAEAKDAVDANELQSIEIDSSI